VCLAIALWPALAAAQASFDAWTIEDGLPQSSVTDIEQTRDGYLWLATFGGLVRFDGVRFTVFDRRTPGIDSVRTRALHEDASGTLWAGTDDGRLIRYQDGRFTTFGPDDGLPPGGVLRIETSASGDVWVTWSNLVTRFDGEQFINYRPGDLPRDVRPRGPAPIGPMMLWWSQDADGIHCLHRGEVALCLPAASLPSTDVLGVSTDQHGAILVQTASAGVIKRRGDRLRHYTDHDGLPAGLPVASFFEDRDGALWIAPRGRPLLRLRDREIDPVAADYTTLHEDREGSLWMGTSTGGLRRLQRHAIAMHPANERLSAANVYSILRDRQGAVWIGTWGGGLNRMSAGAITTVRLADDVRSRQVTAILEDRSGRILVGTESGLAIVAAGTVTSYPDPHNWLRPVWAMHEDEDGTLWFGTDTGLVRHQGTTFTRLTRADGLPDDSVRSLLGARGGGLWIGTLRGVTRLHDGALTSYTERDGYVGSHVRALHEDDRALWIGTYDGGLYRLAEGRLTRYTTADGLHDNGVFQILDDGLGNFWMGSNRGISRVSRAELEDFAAGRRRTIRPVVFAVKDGLSTPECNGGRQPSGTRMPDGTLWIPTLGGIAVVSPDRVRTNPHAPPVHIEAVRVAGSTVPSFRNGIDLAADRNSVEIQYTALSFIKPELVRFRYRLAGFDDDWVEAGARRTASYHRIPPGEYTFQVSAANSDGVWNEIGDSVAIVVVAPVWRRTWFLASLGAAVLAMAALLERRRVVRLQRDHARQQAYARQLVETQERERRRISHELHDSLGQTLFLIRQRARAALEDAGGPSALGDVAGLATRACDEMKEIAYALRPYQLDKIGLTRTIDGMLTRVSDACGIAIEADLDDVDAVFSDDARIHVFRIVQEGVSNIVRHAGATDAAVTIARDGRRVVIEIRDNGRGFDAGDRRRGTAPAGFGLRHLEERARALNGTLEIDARPGGGTRLVIRLDPERTSDAP
jgi:signal transduction histidine kinase/ligand-binding sensor domain-containing protein